MEDKDGEAVAIMQISGQVKTVGKKLPRSMLQGYQLILLFQNFLLRYFLPLHVITMESAADLDIEKGVAVEPTEGHASTDNSTDRDVEGERPHPAISEGKLGNLGPQDGGYLGNRSPRHYARNGRQEERGSSASRLLPHVLAVV
jgi:hypothetical protein